MGLSTIKLCLLLQTWFILSVLLGTSAAVDDCPTAFTKYGEYCFHYNDDPGRNKSSAERYCVDLDSTLPYPTAELSKWQEAVNEAFDGASSFTGAIKQNDGWWRWPDGTVLQDRAWQAHYPLNEQSCSSVSYNSDGQLRDKACSVTQPVLCQTEERVDLETELTEPPATTATSGQLPGCRLTWKGSLIPAVILLIIQLRAVHIPSFAVTNIWVGSQVC
ncbi:unnamed protein product [Meganyctiphanes norvegica]|uniref:C-type lectin domain-containing protein n=1 Tax=Meganyctiphanes norvegica TaxID=48144 RepID=A0AAV2S5F2_MEGNR